MLASLSPIPLALYIHIPWCLRKCPYCDFNSYRITDALPERAYVDALLADLEYDITAIQGRSVDSIFIGGGTPSLFSSEAIARLLEGLAARLNLATGLEITLEANPGTVSINTWQKFSEYRAAGINRLSIGVQSFNADLLQRLGRSHDPEQARYAAEAAYRADFDNFNLDLMVGLPGQTQQQAIADINAAINLEPTHISYYQLTLEPNTPFYRFPPALPDNDEIWLMQQSGQALLAKAGYQQYEVSAYARSDHRCQHNLNYWTFGDYLGIGAGAHGKLTSLETGAIRRYWKLKNPLRYLQLAGSFDGIGGDQLLQTDEIPLEFMMNAMRLIEGVATDLFSQRTGLPKATLMTAVARACEQGLLEVSAQNLRPTPLGWRFLDELLEFLVPERYLVSN